MDRIQVLHGSDGKWHLFDKWAGKACECLPYPGKTEAEAAKAVLLAEMDCEEPFANGPDTNF